MKLKEWIVTNKESFTDTDLRFLLKEAVAENYSLFLSEDTFLEPKKLKYLDNVKSEYIKGTPLAYILGKEIFFGFEFKIDKRVLIPRKETELIVEEAINIINKKDLNRILDLCCGCGNIAISIKKKIQKDMFVVASDISFKSLQVFEVNNKFHKQNIKVVNAGLLEAFKNNTFDLIVSNPPYVETKELKGSLNYEPEIALNAGHDGLYFIKDILKKAHFYLRPEGYLIMEIGYAHKSYLNNFIDNTNLYKKVDWIKDYSGHYRAIVLKKL